ncbi:MAG TPA: 4Fe-4S dicluster domain-containing protein [Nitrospiria bacterium]|nr:4Fe-4S dicluster domain-containing protein [Nitrospiria bacterium]
MTIENKLYLVRFKPDDDSHLKVVDPEVCRHKCPPKSCSVFCPANVYTWNEVEQRINIAHEGCLECGTCFFGCPNDNISWKNPRGGYGVMYKFG